jgi:PKD repeat protein
MRHLPRRRGRRKSRGQSLVEFALIVPVVLVLLGVVADAGRLFFSYVAITNAAREGAIFGAKSPNCDVSKTGCANPNNVAWKVAQDAGSAATMTATCLAPSGIPRANVSACLEGDTYRINVRQPVGLLTPLVRVVFGSTIWVGAGSSALVFNPATYGGAPPPPSPSPSPSPDPSASPSPDPSVGPCTAPVITFSGSPVKGQAPHNVTFVGTSDQTPTSVLWTFGDGFSDSSGWPSTIHTYTAKDKFTVTLTVNTGAAIACATTLTHQNYIQAQ